MTESGTRLRAAAAWVQRQRWQRWLVRAPIGLFRARLGLIFSSRLLLLEHTGRTTGARRYAVLAVAGRPRPGTYLVASERGTRAQWYRNIRANPSVRVWVGGRHRAAATAQPLTAGEAKAVLDRHAQRHPRAWAKFSPVFEDIFGAPLTDMPIIALELTQHT
jgi:deazaflavin-dependent oxidoreductase (nitroreductase family)